QLFSRPRMDETGRSRMERLSAHAERSARAAAVYRVTDERMADILHVDADLMRPPRLQLQLHIGVIAEPLEYGEMRDGVLASAIRDGKQLAIVRIPPERSFDRPPIVGDRPVHQRPV